MAFKQFSVYLGGLHVVYLLDTRYRFDFKYLKEPKLIVVHWTGSIPQTIEEYYTKSVERVGQPKTHFIINSKGTIFQTLPLNVMGNHIPRRNEYSIGISLHNIVSARSVTQALRYSFIKLVNILKDEFGTAELKTHKELMVEDVGELMMELGLMPGEIERDADEIDLSKFLTLSGKRLERYKKKVIEYIEDNLERSLYTSMLVDRISYIPDCPGNNYEKVRLEPSI